MHSNAKMNNKGIKKRETLHRNISLFKSGRQDSNLRPPGPKPGALPDCATPRLLNPPIVSIDETNVYNQREVGATGFEPATTWSQTRRATGLRYTPFSNCECKGITIFLHTQNFKQVFCTFHQQPPTFHCGTLFVI